MKKTFLIILVFITAMYSHATSITIVNNKAGKLKEAIEQQGTNPNNVTNLTLRNGEVNGTDIRLIRQMGGVNFENEKIKTAMLSNLDMSSCNIVAGGLSYVKNTKDEEFYTANNIIGIAMFLNCHSIVELKIPLSVTALEGGFNFSSMPKLKSIILNDNIETIPTNAFAETGITTITLPKNLKTIDKSAFYRSALTSITIPQSVQTINDKTFRECSSLESITWSLQVKEFSTEVFAGCIKLTTINNFPTDITFIGANAFADCRSLMGVTIKVGKEAQINSTAFFMASIDDFIVDPSNPNYSSADGILYEGQFKTLLCCNNKVQGDITLPTSTIDINSFAFCYSKVKTVTASSLKTIGQEAFAFSLLEAITLKEGITEIGTSAFQNCTKLTKIEIPSTIKILHKGTFLNCFSLNSIKLNEGLTQIGGSSFYFTNITSLTIPSTVDKIWDGALSGMGNLNNLTVAPTNTTYKSIQNVIYTINEDSLIHVAPHNGYEKLATPEKCVYIAEGAFSENNNIKEIVFTNPDAELEASCFNEMLVIERITFPKNATVVTSYNCNSLTTLKEIVLPQELVAIEEGGFSGCTNLKNISLPKNTQTIGEKAFSGCSAMEYVQSFATTPPQAGDNNDSSAFANTNIDEIALYVPIGTKSAYHTTFPWSQFKEIIEIDAPVSIGKVIDHKTRTVVTGLNDAIQIDTQTNDILCEVFGANGEKLKSLTISNTTLIPIEKGIYFVRINNSNSTKIIVR